MTTDAIARFDELDVFCLSNQLSGAQLRREILSAEVKAAVAEMFHDTEYQTADDLFPHRDYANCCREAIRWQQNRKPKIKPQPGQIDVSAIKSRCDIVSTIEQYTRLRKSGRNFTGRCPIHEDKYPSMTVYPDQQTFHCYGCNRGGDIFSFIQAVEHIDFRGAATMLGRT